MLRPPVTVPIAFVRGMVSGVEGRGHAREPLLAEAGIAPELLHQAGARVTADQYVALFRLTVDRLDDECLGFLSRRVKRGSLALVARSAVSAQTLEVAIRRCAHAFRLLQDDVELVLVREDSLAGLTLRMIDADAATRPFLHELLLRVFWRLLAWFAGGQLPAARFDFSIDMPSYAGDYGKVFPGPLRFGQPRSGVYFDAYRLQSPVRRNEEALRAFLADVQAQVIVPRRGDDLVSAGVRDYLQRTQPAWADLPATAEALHMASSTLQRRLAVEGTSFQALKDELRRDLAIVRLNTSTVPLQALADELGFADGPAFQRAFKGWTGSSPGAYRRRGFE
ncbi:AraC family transcriptional regulator [Variovorax sp. J22P168]|uniref:AraC family transcriptional regulator n=1 Tax=Variovorax jilinensis TaxID=3053513 RepID=UPI0025791A81|nr:AraC family transcriptional regulator [Variovorax sp. J22P168]MDM0014502.1 AraC family transcriptional regulator [Variovorax sp. J22P168]